MLQGEITGLVCNVISSHVRRFLKERSHNKCERCGWSEINIYTNRIPLQAHHKDGNFRNTIPDNLEYICPNCHSLTENFGSRGKGRPGRAGVIQSGDDATS